MCTKGSMLLFVVSKNFQAGFRCTKGSMLIFRCQTKPSETFFVGLTKFLRNSTCSSRLAKLEGSLVVNRVS